jgi:hypothetical protein
MGMVRVLLAMSFAAWAGAAQAAEWRVHHVNAPARVLAIETVGGQVQVNAGGLWYKILLAAEDVSLAFIDTPAVPKRPDGALSDGRVATGSRDIARAWLAEAAARDRGVRGAKVEAGSLVIETRDGKRQTLQLKDEAAFEDLSPQIGDLDGSGHDQIVVAKSYPKRGSSLAVIGLRKGRYEIVGETPPLPTKVATNIVIVSEASGPPAMAVGLADGSLVVIRRN